MKFLINLPNQCGTDRYISLTGLRRINNNHPGYIVGDVQDVLRHSDSINTHRAFYFNPNDRIDSWYIEFLSDTYFSYTYWDKRGEYGV